MGCAKDSELIRQKNKVLKRWTESKTLKKWNLIGDVNLYKRLYFDATEKDFEAGIPITVTDLKKFDLKIKDQIRYLESPGDMAGKFKKLMWVGYAKAMKNPITKNFFHTLSDANQFRNKHTAVNMKEYSQIIKDLKEAVVLFEGQNDLSGTIAGKFKKTKYDDLQADLNRKESEYFKQLLSEGKAENLNASDRMVDLMRFLDGEGAVFQDFMEVIGSGSVEGVKSKYAGKRQLELRKLYINKLDNAATRWSKIVKISNKELNQGIENLAGVIELKYGSYSPVAETLIKEIRRVQKNLVKSEDKGYAPHYVLDLLKQSLEMRDKIDLSKRMPSQQLDNILSNYVTEVTKINTQLTARLKSKSKDSMPVEYFTRNPALYITQFINDVSKFNYSTYVDHAYLRGMRDLSNVVFKNPGDKTGEAAESYLKYLNGMYSEATSKNRIENSKAGNNMHRIISSMQFVSKLGFNTRSPIRNLSQSMFTWKWFGAKEWNSSRQEYKDNPTYKDLLKTAIDKYGLEFYDIGSVTEGAISQLDLANFGVEYRDGYLTRNDHINILDKMTKAGLDITAKSAIFMQWAENFNRKVTFKAAFGTRMRQLKQWEKFADHRNPDVQEAMGKKAGVYAARVTELLHFQYGKHGKSELLKSKAGSLLFQFQHYAASAINLEAIMIKDYIKAFKAGDKTGYEAQRVRRSIGLALISSVVSIPMGINMTSYLGNEVIGRLMEFVYFITGDDEEKLDSFYGKGPIMSQSVILSDMMEIYNLGLAAGYWDLQGNPEDMANILMGIREYDKINDTEFAGKVAGMTFSELERLITHSGPAFVKSGFMGGLRAEFGLYPGETELGIPVRTTRKKIMGSETMQNVSNIYENAFGTSLVKKSKKTKGKRVRDLNPSERKKALQSLAGF